MHPAPSIIVFTVLSGLGYGLAFWLSLGLFHPPATATRIAWVVALALISAGLLSSTLHLGNPQRAWRAFSQWRSSWLSREGVLAILTFLPLLWGAGRSVLAGEGPGVVGVVGALMCLATVLCTAMIYASLRTVRAWHSWLTPACFALFSLGGGALLAVLFSLWGTGVPALLAVAALVLLALAGAAKAAWTANMRRPDATTPETATGLGRIGRVRLLERPHAMENYLTTEMVYRVGRKHADTLRVVAFGLSVGLPLVCLVLVSMAVAPLPLTLLAVGSHIVGMLAERWLFFAEARHVVANYYGE